MKSIIYSRKGLSLVEVLVATGIIAVALYGLVLSISLQSLSAAQSRQDQYIKALHLQLASEVLDGWRTPANPPTFYNDALPGVALNYKETFDSGTHLVTSTISWTSALGATVHTSILSFAYWE